MDDDKPAAPRAALFSLPEWHDSHFDPPPATPSDEPESKDEFFAAMAAATQPSPVCDNQAERDFFDLAQRESIAADARRGASGSQNAICLESGLLTLESGLVTLESGLFELSPSGSFEFPNQSSAWEIKSDAFEITGIGSSAGGVTDAVNQIAPPEPASPPPIPAPPPQRQVVGMPRGLTRREPEPGRAAGHRPEPTQSSESFPARIASVTGPRLAVRSESGATENAGRRYASTTSGHERVATRSVKIKVRQD